MKSAVTIRLDAELERQLDQVAESSGKTRSEIVREAPLQHIEHDCGCRRSACRTGSAP